MPNKQYFFLFTEGDMYERSIGDLCVCDHAVTEDEWIEFEHKYLDDIREMWSKVPRVEHPGYTLLMPDYSSQEYKALYKWKQYNEPMQAFQKLHNMQVIEYTELNGD